MKRFGIFVVGVGVIVVVWHWMSSGSPSFANFPPAVRGPWMAIGDSLTAGTGATAEEAYPAALGRRLGLEILNLGVPGSTTADGLEQLPETLRLRPRVVLLCLGGNDSLQRQPLTQTFSNLAAIVDELQRSGAFVVLVGVRSASVLDQHRRSFASLAREKRVLLVPDILDGVFGNPRLMADTIHPNAAGYQRIAERIASALEPYLDELR
jgi:lysophospholipase L1-like esterase